MTAPTSRCGYRYEDGTVCGMQGIRSEKGTWLHVDWNGGHAFVPEQPSPCGYKYEDGTVCGVTDGGEAMSHADLLGHAFVPHDALPAFDSDGEPIQYQGPRIPQESSTDEHGVCDAYVPPRDGHGRWGCETCGFSKDMHPQEAPESEGELKPCDHGRRCYGHFHESLQSCPFCAYAAIRETVMHDSRYAECPRCGAMAPLGNWNRRAPESVPTDEARINQLEGAIAEIDQVVNGEIEVWQARSMVAEIIARVQPASDPSASKRPWRMEHIAAGVTVREALAGNDEALAAFDRILKLLDDLQPVSDTSKAEREENERVLRAFIPLANDTPIASEEE